MIPHRPESHQQSLSHCPLSKLEKLFSIFFFSSLNWGKWIQISLSPLKIGFFSSSNFSFFSRIDFLPLVNHWFYVNISYDSVSTFLTILFLQETKWKAQMVVAGAILPEKALREKLNTVIEDEFSKVALRNTIKYFKPHSENDWVGATIKVLEYSLTKKEVPKPYQTLLKEIRKDSPVSSWLPSYSQQDTRLLVTFLNQECDVFEMYQNSHRHSLTWPD